MTKINQKTLTRLILVTLMGLSLLSACVNNQTETLTKYTKVATEVGFKDIAVNFIAYTKDEASFNKYFNTMVNEFTRLGHLYDKYNNYTGLNNLKTINDNAGISAVVVDQELINMLLLAKEWYTLSNQTFDITLGSVLNIWHDYREAGKLKNQANQLGDIPLLSNLQAADVFVGWQYVVINDEANTVYLTDTHTSLDVGGIGKGYATDLVASKLKADGLTTGIISIGESSIVTIGSKPNNVKWGIGISSPVKGAEIRATIETVYMDADISISTSGDDQNYYQATDNNYYHHIIDPSTLFPVKSDIHEVTVFTSDSAGVAEALSKTLFILPFETAYQYVIDYNSAHPDKFLGALWVFNLGQQPAGYTYETTGDYAIIHSDTLRSHSSLVQ
jgi:thiamine biosynthesis lipoprotein